MSFESERAYLETRFSTEWVETPIKWPNVDFVTSGVSEFVAMTIIHDESYQAQTGSLLHLYRYESFISIQIFVLPNRGSRRAYELADLIADIWRTLSYNNITIENPILVEIGVIEGWYQLGLINPFYRNEFLATPS